MEKLRETPGKLWVIFFYVIKKRGRADIYNEKIKTNYVGYCFLTYAKTAMFCSFYTLL